MTLNLPVRDSAVGDLGGSPQDRLRETLEARLRTWAPGYDAECSGAASAATAAFAALHEPDPGRRWSQRAIQEDRAWRRSFTANRQRTIDNLEALVSRGLEIRDREFLIPVFPPLKGGGLDPVGAVTSDWLAWRTLQLALVFAAGADSNDLLRSLRGDHRVCSGCSVVFRSSDPRVTRCVLCKKRAPVALGITSARTVFAGNPFLTGTFATAPAFPSLATIAGRSGGRGVYAFPQIRDRTIIGWISRMVEFCASCGEMMIGKAGAVWCRECSNASRQREYRARTGHLASPQN